MVQEPTAGLRRGETADKVSVAELFRRHGKPVPTGLTAEAVGGWTDHHEVRSLRIPHSPWPDLESAVTPPAPRAAPKLGSAWALGAASGHELNWRALAQLLGLGVASVAVYSTLVWATGGPDQQQLVEVNKSDNTSSIPNTTTSAPAPTTTTQVVAPPVNTAPPRVTYVAPKPTPVQQEPVVSPVAPQPQPQHAKKPCQPVWMPWCFTGAY
ncbi:hypothetical protein D5S17_17250 [Pseudonocardiaceae bacterium YIM PH 21723]|nr:hypothetical protein D5S17_17250 [Pseudonocardiaceae bacterium YIM PH 21723]